MRLPIRVLEFFRSNVKGVKPDDRSRMLEKLPLDLRSKITSYLYLPTVKARLTGSVKRVCFSGKQGMLH